MPPTAVRREDVDLVVRHRQPLPELALQLSLHGRYILGRNNRCEWTPVQVAERRPGGIVEPRDDAILIDNDARHTYSFEGLLQVDRLVRTGHPFGIVRRFSA